MGGRGAWALRRRGGTATLSRRAIPPPRQTGAGGGAAAVTRPTAAETTIAGNVRITGASDAELARVLGGNYNREIVARMFGAPDNSRITLEAYGNTVSAYINHPNLGNGASLSLERRGSDLVYHGGSVFATGANSQGLASGMVMRGIAYGASRGVTRVEVGSAIGGARNSRATGSLTWAKMGLNKSLTASERASLPAHLRGAKDLNEVMLTKAGVNWWRANRHTYNGYLDLKSGSNGLKLARRAARTIGLNIRLKPSRANTQARFNARRARRSR